MKNRPNDGEGYSTQGNSIQRVMLVKKRKKKKETRMRFVALVIRPLISFAKWPYGYYRNNGGQTGVGGGGGRIIADGRRDALCT